MQDVSANIKRIRAHLNRTQEDIASAAGLSKKAYAAIENGKAQPRVRSIEAIAEALGVPLRHLFEPLEPLTAVRFRSKKKLRSRNQILTDVGRWLADYNELEELLGEHRAFLLEGLTLGKADRDPSEVAEAARAKLGLTADEPIRDICGLLNAAGVKLFAMDVASDAFFGLSVGADDGGPAIAVNTWDRISVERWIFSAAHELGHLLLHLDSYGGSEEGEDELQEREADAFAAAFLMPNDVFWREWKKTYGLPFVERVLKVKRIFRVSYRTVLHRLAPTYSGPGNIWVAFNIAHKRARGAHLVKHYEPDAIDKSEFSSPAAERLRGKEPDYLSRSDFVGDRLAGLVRSAVESEELGTSRGAEILGISLMDMRALAASWVM